MLLCSSLWSENWVIGAQHFESNKPDSQILKALGDSMPSLILNSLGNTLNRDVTPDEKFERKKYELQKNRLSLFLQLSAEYKKRDNLVLNNYSGKQLSKKINEADKKIKELEEKLRINLEEEAEEKALSEKNQAMVDSGKYSTLDISTEGKKWLYLFKNMFVKNEPLVSQETITFYRDDVSKLFTPSSAALSEGIGSYTFEKEVYSAKINTLITGKITSFGDYLSVNIDAYLFPGSQRIASVMEVGSLRELDVIANNIAGKLVPAITNSMPVELNIFVSPKEAQNVKFYFNDEIQTLGKDGLRVHSGISSFQVQADGYKSISTTYDFLGNHKYLIEIQLEQENDSFVYLLNQNDPEVSIYANGKSVDKLENNYSKITINGQTILGQIVNKEGLSGFYYIPEKDVETGITLKVKQNPKNNADYIDKRRKWMYGSYSALMVSLIPKFICSGKFNNYTDTYYILKTDESYNRAKKWGTASYITNYVSLGCGVWFGYELVRYLIAANTVLPKKAKTTDIIFEDVIKIDTSNQNETDENAIEINTAEVEE